MRGRSAATIEDDWAGAGAEDCAKASAVLPAASVMARMARRVRARVLWRRKSMLTVLAAHSVVKKALLRPHRVRQMRCPGKIRYGVTASQAACDMPIPCSRISGGPDPVAL